MFIPFVVVVPGMICAAVVGDMISLKNGPNAGGVTYNDAMLLMIRDILPNGLLGVAVAGLIASFMAGMAANIGTAAFDSFEVLHPESRALTRAVPYGERVQFAAAGKVYGLGMPFEVVDMQLGRVALKHRHSYLRIAADGSARLVKKSPGVSESFQWMETPDGDLLLMSLTTNRFLRIDPVTRRISADSAGPLPDGSDGVRFTWSRISNRSP
jgi:hypothetical protein